MDLGATVCTRKLPKCNECPLKTKCRAYHADTAQLYPTPTFKKKIPTKKVYFLIITNGNQEILLERRPPIGIWGGLWSFPECLQKNEIIKICFQRYGLTVKLKPAKLTGLTHTFSHFHLLITPLLLQATNSRLCMETPNLIWYDAQQIQTVGTPKPVSHYLKCLDSSFVKN